MKDVVNLYRNDIGSMHSLPKWAQEAIVAGAYQQGRAEALKYAFEEVMKKQNPR